jgi:hypothetical protein
VSVDHVTGPTARGAARPVTHGEGGDGSSDGAGAGEDGGHREPPVPARGAARRRALAGAVLLAGLTAAAVAVARSGGGDGGGDDRTAALTTVPVEVRDLVLVDDYDGELGFGETSPVTAGRSGVVTGVTAVGTSVGQGDVLFHLDLQPTVLVHGEVPVFRDLSAGVTPGADVGQLEQALVDLGYGEGVTVDSEFTDATAAAVEAWEEALGRAEPDGVVARGDVVFAPADLRIAAVGADRGTQVQSGGDVVEVTATSKVVTLQLTVDQVADVEAGTPVTIELPDGTEVAGTIADVATEPVGGDSGEGATGEESEETYPVTVALDDPATADAFETGTVGATVERGRTEDALAVPVLALVALSEGGYAVQVADGTDSEGYVYVPVEAGTMADDWVEVSGEGIEAGVDVVVPE